MRDPPATALAPHERVKAAIPAHMQGTPQHMQQIHRTTTMSAPTFRPSRSRQWLKLQSSGASVAAG